MSAWQIALVKEQGIEFGVVVVNDAVIDDSLKRNEIWRWWTARLGRPTALIGASRHQTFGRDDIVRWLSSVHPSRLPWRSITI
jgi:hypothetical protein